MFTLNKNKLIDIKRFNQPGSADFPSVCFKNQEYRHAIEETSEYCKNVLSVMLMSCSNLKRYQYVDIKVHDLKDGQQTANGLWHLDSSLNPVKEYENFLFVSGNLALTEFVNNELSIPLQEDSKSFSRFINTKKLDIIRIKTCTITKYDGTNVHRGPKSTGKEKRLLIRLINTDNRLPSYYIK